MPFLMLSSLLIAFFASVFSTSIAAIDSGVHATSDAPFRIERRIAAARDWSTRITATEAYSRASKSYSTTGATYDDVFEVYGATPIQTLFTGKSMRTGSLEERFFGDGASEYFVGNTDAAIVIRNNNTQQAGIQRSGHTLTLHQNLMSGLFVSAVAEYTTTAYNVHADATGSDSKNPAVKSLINNLDTILLNAHRAPLSTTTKDYDSQLFVAGTPEHSYAHVALGWQGAFVSDAFVLPDLTFSMSTGYVLNVRPTRATPRVDFLPHNRTDGVVTHFQLHGHVVPRVGFFASAATTVYLERIKEIPLAQYARSGETVVWHTGPIILDRILGTINPGTLWVLNGGASVDLPLGISVEAGYHFASQEQTQLQSLSAPKITQVSQIQWDTKSTNESINTKWVHQGIWLSAELKRSYEKDGRFFPALSLLYYIPIAGKNSVATSSVGGSVHLGLQWAF